MKIYFAGPLFSQAEKEFNERLAAKLEGHGLEVFLPQRDGVESHKEPYSSMPKEERRKELFELDARKIQESEVFLFILDGRVPDEGACVELGIAYTSRKIHGNKMVIIGLHTDSRAAFMGSKLNPMVRVPMDYIAENEEELISYLSKTGI